MDPTPPTGAGMAALIPLRDQGGTYWVDARLLHVALSIATRFNDWVTRRLADTLAKEHEDFYSELSKGTPGRPTTEYFLSVDLAKEFAMLERNDRGRAVRRYFIDAEKLLRSGGALAPPPPEPLSQARQSLLAAQAIVDLEDRTLAIERRLDNTPIVQFPDQEAVIRELCQELGQVMPGGWRAAYNAFKNHFGYGGVPLAKYSSLPSHRYLEACTYLRLLIAEHRRNRSPGGDPP